MAQGLNRATIVGHLGRMPEMRYTPAGKPVTSFSIVTEYSWASSDGSHHQDRDWFNVIAWGELAEACRRALKKGQLVYVEGRIKNRRWTDENQSEHTCAEVMAQDVIALD